jgi:Mn-containing catalase
MFMRVDRLLTELPMPKKQDPNAGAALQELLGGKYGEMSTLNNYMYQSFNFRSKSKLRAIYDIVASITAEEVGHVELVSNGVAIAPAARSPRPRAALPPALRPCRPS